MADPAQFQMYNNMGGMPPQNNFQFGGAQQDGGFGYQQNRGGMAGQGSQKFKTALCRHFEQQGKCYQGDRCSFAHGQAELRQSTGVSIKMSECLVVNE